MSLPECAKCEDPHRSRKTPEWNDVDYDECAHFSALAADEQRDRSKDDQYLASAKKFRAAMAAREAAVSVPAAESPVRSTT